MTDEEWEAYCAELWSDDPEVVISAAPLDANAEHGSNTPVELDSGDSTGARLIAAVKARLRIT